MAREHHKKAQERLLHMAVKDPAAAIKTLVAWTTDTSVKSREDQVFIAGLGPALVEKMAGKESPLAIGGIASVLTATHSEKMSADTRKNMVKTALAALDVSLDYCEEHGKSSGYEQVMKSAELFIRSSTNSMPDTMLGALYDRAIRFADIATAQDKGGYPDEFHRSLQMLRWLTKDKDHTRKRNKNIKQSAYMLVDKAARIKDETRLTEVEEAWRFAQDGAVSKKDLAVLHKIIDGLQEISFSGYHGPLVKAVELWQEALEHQSFVSDTVKRQAINKGEDLALAVGAKYPDLDYRLETINRIQKNILQHETNMPEMDNKRVQKFYKKQWQLFDQLKTGDVLSWVELAKDVWENQHNIARMQETKKIDPDAVDEAMQKGYDFVDACIATGKGKGLVQGIHFLGEMIDADYPERQYVAQSAERAQNIVDAALQMNSVHGYHIAFDGVKALCMLADDANAEDALQKMLPVVRGLKALGTEESLAACNKILDWAEEQSETDLFEQERPVVAEQQKAEAEKTRFADVLQIFLQDNPTSRNTGKPKSAPNQKNTLG